MFSQLNINDIIALERDFRPEAAIEFAARNWSLVTAIVIIYVMGIQIGTAFMARKEKAFDLRWALAAWNAFLCIFSFIGMCKTVIFYINFQMDSLLIFSPIYFDTGANINQQFDDADLRTNSVH